MRCAVALGLLAGAAQAESFPVPQQDYALALDLSGCEVAEDRPERDGSVRYVRAHCPDTRVNVSFWIEPAEKRGNSGVCRDTWWPRDSGGVTAFEMRELGELALVDYTIGDGPLKQRNVRAYLAYRNTWIDFHLSRVETANRGTGDFDRLLRSARIDDP